MEDMLGTVVSSILGDDIIKKIKPIAINAISNMTSLIQDDEIVIIKKVKDKSTGKLRLAYFLADKSNLNGVEFDIKKAGHVETLITEIIDKVGI